MGGDEDEGDVEMDGAEAEDGMPIDLTQWRAKTSSGYMGVYKTSQGKFQAQIACDGAMKHLGNYDTAEEAA